MSMRESPRTRRLRSDYRAMQELCGDSSIIEFTTSGEPPESYLVRFKGRGLWRPGTGNESVCVREDHEVGIQLGASYPRMMPELSWRTPIFHPNISASGIVCLGGYGTHWVPSVSLAELCIMLWDMIRYKNFDVESPYNREAAGWTKEQLHFALPLDVRPLRDRKAGAAPVAVADPPLAVTPAADDDLVEVTFLEPEIVDPELLGLEGIESEILDAEIIEAEVVIEPPQGPDILFID